MNLIRLRDLMSSHPEIFNNDYYSPVGKTVFAHDGSSIGDVEGALVDPNTGRLRYLILDVGGWFSSKRVVVPVGMARLTDEGVYFDTLTKDQVQAMDMYDDKRTYTYDEMEAHDNRVLNTEAVAPHQREQLYNAPDRLQLLEERLTVNKEKYIAGSVEVGKHVETRQQDVAVDLRTEEVVLERRAVEPRPVEGAVLGADSQTIRVDLEAERANVGKQAYVVEEVEIGKNAKTHTQTFTETVGKEVLDVKETGELARNTDNLADKK